MFLVFLAGTTTLSGAQATRWAKPEPLRDGFLLAGLDGKLTKSGNEDSWFFEFASAVTDDKGLIEAGQQVRLLACSTLEKMTAEAQAQNAWASYRLWGTVTKYKNENFIFATYFLPVSEAKPSEPAGAQQEKAGPKINEPNDVIIIPADALEMLKAKRTIRLAELKKPLESEEDRILADRTGFLVERTQTGWWAVFEFDALGRNLQNSSIRLLPCQILEQIQAEQSADFNRLRFQVAGIVTKYKSDYYLLLQRASRIYSYGNFAR